ncbi:hypothetical protein [sulfur-oxidizing endosymbiont of Gigantopelta aegis]|uniref:hypothetical protein n=1 Tax=sulfur-oxidizing endosymbiont of Gigantopelta aegis TaxID=2794934 RepID=UPI0018DC1A80|nr:hypothetical protein [sulfur-oxidizing endosymbiont of Gigantopelta aegis]
MAKTLYDFEPEFRKSVVHCQIIFDALESKAAKNYGQNNLNLSLVSLLTEPVSSKVLESAKINQLLAFVFDYSLAQIWLQKASHQVLY